MEHTPGETIKFLLLHPLDSFQALFVNHSDDVQLDYLKAELHIILLCSGLPFLFWKPHYLVMLLPIYAQKLFHDNHYM
ncbi:MAG: hypothetical protein CL840_09020 [Crocinitomicaceae bacterium]|nr:hypothetical protein [Crocinitomicaceae bacterium]